MAGISRVTRTNWGGFIGGSSAIYDGAMHQFFAIPGSTDKIRIKIQKPLDADDVVIKYKTTPWLDSEGVEAGIYLDTIVDDTPYYGTNKWYEQSGFVSGSLYYFRAFPRRAKIFSNRMEQNETRCKAGGLLAEYTMDEITGSTILDTSGNGINGTIFGASVSDLGLVGDALYGNGTSQYANLGVADSTFALLNATVVVFFNASSTDAQTYLLNFSGDKAIYGSLTMSIYQNRYFFAAGAVSQFFDKSFDAWHMGCIKYTGNAIKWGIDGELIAATKDHTTSPGNSWPMRLLTNRQGSGGFATGMIDQVRIYNRELEDYELAALYNVGMGC